MRLKPGDLVNVHKLTHWGSLSVLGIPGMLVRRTYLGYTAADSRYLVLFDDGTVEERRANVIRVR